MILHADHNQMPSLPEEEILLSKRMLAGSPTSFILRGGLSFSTNSICFSYLLVHQFFRFLRLASLLMKDWWGISLREIMMRSARWKQLSGKESALQRLMEAWESGLFKTLPILLFFANLGSLPAREAPYGFNGHTTKTSERGVSRMSKHPQIALEMERHKQKRGCFEACDSYHRKRPQHRYLVWPLASWRLHTWYLWWQISYDLGMGDRSKVSMLIGNGAWNQFQQKFT